MNSLKKFFKSSPASGDGELAIIPSGQLYLRRKPGSPKSESECLYTDSAAIIREQSPHKFELIVQKVYAEGEEQLKGDDDDEEEEAEVTQSFIIDQSLKVHLVHQTGTLLVSWRNPEDEGETFEFLVDETVKSNEVDHFMHTVHCCCFERKYKKSSAGVKESQLDEFFYDPEIEALEDFTSGITSLSVSSSNVNDLDYRAEAEDDEEDDEDDDDSIFEDAVEGQTTKTDVISNDTSSKQLAPVEVKGEELIVSTAELYLYDPEAEKFQLQDSSVIAKVIDQGKFQYWLSVKSETAGSLGTSISSELAPEFNYEKLSFVFNYITGDIMVSWLLRFKNQASLVEFQKAYMIAQWEGANKAKWGKVDQGEQKYILEGFNDNEQDEEMEDYYKDIEEEEEDSDEEEEGDQNINLRTGLRKEEFSDSEDDEDQAKNEFMKGSRNRNLTVSYKNDRSYLTRGDRIGIFKTTENDDLEFVAAVKDLKISGAKKSLSPSKMMLHTEDRTLVLQGQEKDRLYKMDIERGQIIEEWKVKEDLPIVGFGPSKKFNQMTGEQTFLGISDKGLFKIDPRLSGEKLVESEYKSYATKNDFSSFGTTENGYIAVASNKGDIRLYDRLGIRAKSLIPALGDPITSTEVSADGKWLLCTCQTYLILIDMSIKSGNNAGELGFKKSFGKEPPKARRLGLSAEHIAFIRNNTNQGLSFSHARFNTGLNAKEQTIVSSSGPYAITWSLRKILRGDVEPYLIKKYGGNVVDDNFRFGSDKNVIVALEDDISLANKKDFRKADRKSLAFTPRRI